MHQVEGQGDAADQVNDNDPSVRERILHQPEKIAHLDTVICLLIFRHIGEPGLDPEVLEMDHQEEQDEGTEPAHIPGVPFTALVTHRDLVADGAFSAVLDFEDIGLDDMKDKTNEQTDLQNPHDDGGRHEIGGHIEHFTSVHIPDTGIEPDMNDQKKNQENTRKAHDEFLAYGRCKEFRPFHAFTIIL